MQRRPYFSVDVVLLNVSKMYLGIILLSSLMIVSSYGCLLREVVKKNGLFTLKRPPWGPGSPNGDPLGYSGIDAHEPHTAHHYKYLQHGICTGFNLPIFGVK